MSAFRGVYDWNERTFWNSLSKKAVELHPALRHQPRLPLRLYRPEAQRRRGAGERAGVARTGGEHQRFAGRRADAGDCADRDRSRLEHRPGALPAPSDP